MASSNYMKLTKILLQLYILGILVGNVQSDEKCQPGLDTPGYTVPSGDILVEYGNPLEITCILNEKYVLNHTYSSKNLYFKRGEERIPSEMVTVLDERSIKLYISQPPLMDAVFTCMVEKNKTSDAVCLNMVVVGVKPQPVTDFECIGYNYENLTCTWTTPNNYVKTEYKLIYYFRGRASRHYPFSCPKIVEDKKNRKMSCFWDINTYPQYRPVQETYYFVLNMTNKLGTNQINKTFSHFQHVLSGPPENLTVISTTTESIYLRWSVPNTMHTFPPGLQHRVLYQSELDSKQWTLGGFLTANQTRDKKEVYFNLTGLKYAHRLYDIRVSLRSNASLPDDESMWSKNASITIWTKSKEPGMPPRTTMGSFEVVSSSNIMVRDVYIYWQQIPLEFQNGELIQYEVKNTDDAGEQVENKNAYAKFRGLNISKSYKFLIWSKNEVGRSHNYSTVIVPDAASKVDDPTAVTKVEFGNGKYELSWEPPKNTSIINYTIFWCTNDRDRPYQCTGYLDWVIVPGNITAYNISVPDAKIYQFAIAANTLTSSSGMTWAACTVIPNSVVGKMKNVWINDVGSDYIEVGWKLDCSDRIGIVEGFVITYCIVQPKETECKSSEEKVKIKGNAMVVKGTVRNLKPYTTYLLTVAVVTKHNSLSQQSDPLRNTTLEAAPSVPLNLKVESVTNNSITVSWQPPAETNGILKYYEVHYDNERKRVDSPNETRYVLTNLTSYKYYDINVIACTVFCSPPTPNIRVRTEVGYPGKIKQPTVKFSNNTHIIVDWEQPTFEQRRGENDLYEVRFKEKLDYENRTIPIINVTGTNYAIEDCGDQGKYNTFYISVRAVNVINGSRYEGPWSDELESYCRTPPRVVPYVLAPIVFIVVLLIFYASKRIYGKCQDMGNVEIKIPPGLSNNANSDAETINHWNPEKLQEDDIRHPPPDEQLLLEKLSDRNSTGDSSGCSSGHESVTSSVDSNTRVPSPTDSGTVEVAHTSSTEEVNKTNLRLRKSYITMPDTAIRVNKPKSSGDSYCVLGVDPNPTSDTSPPYVPAAIPHLESSKLPSVVPTSSPPYVLTGDNNKIMHGYVPLANSNVPEKNFSYVMAGSKPNSVPELIRLNSSSSTSSEDKLMYVQVSDLPNTVMKSSPESNVWHQPAYDSGISKLGYVSIGDAPPPVVNDNKSGYYPHKNFETKCLKED